MVLPVSSGVEADAIRDAYTRQASLPEGSGEDVGLDFKLHLPPWPIASQSAADSVAEASELPDLPDTLMPSSQVEIAHRRSPSPLVLAKSPLFMAVDAVADVFEDLSHIPDSPMGFARFEMGSRTSFDTSVRDLVQSRPDSPIGGQEADSMAAIKPKRSFNVGTLVINQGKRILPRIEVSCADIDPCCEEDMNKRPKSRSKNRSKRVSESATGTENLAPHSELQTGTCGNTPIVTAPETPRAHYRTGSNDGSFEIDDRELTLMDVRDFALASDGTQSKKASKVPHPEPAPKSELVQMDPSDPDYCEDCVSPMTIQPPPPKKDPKTKSTLDEKIPSGKTTPSTDAVEKTRKYGKIEKAGKNERTETMGKTGKTEKDGKTLPIPTGVLTDSTGQLTAPGTPKPKKCTVLKVKGQMAIRRVRGAVFRTPVMTVVVGRQLGPPTSQALKLISKGVPVEPPKIVPSTPVSVPLGAS